jgi:hypothetical protein
VGRLHPAADAEAGQVIHRVTFSPSFELGVRGTFMKSCVITAYCLALAALAGCASTDITERQTYQHEKFSRPARILVYDFAATYADLPEWSAPARRHDATMTTPPGEELEKGRELGAKVANHLVEEIREMGLPAVAAAGRTLRTGDVMLVGYFESIEEGSAAKRVALGFGAGGAELKTQVEGYHMTDQGPRELGSRDLDSAGGKSPGLVVPLAVGIATHNPIGLVAGTALHVAGEVSGKSTIDGSAQRTAKKIGDELKVIFQQEGWI